MELRKIMATTPDFDIAKNGNLDEWAGEKIVERGRRYQRDGKVEELVLLKDGRLGAVVRGTRGYRVAVGFGESGRMESDCTCPYGSNCKHAVAAILEYLHRMEAGRAVPVSTDAKYEVLNREGGQPGDQDSTAEATAALEAWLRGQSVKQLVVLLLGVCREHPDVATELTDRIAVESGQASGLMRKIRRQTRTLIEGPNWQDGYGYGDSPDYSTLLKMMELALPLGVADELLNIMASILEAVQEQIGIYDHDGEFAEAAAPCYATAVVLLRASTLDHTQKLLWAVEHVLADEYSLGDSLERYLAEKHPSGSWSEVADELLGRLKKRETFQENRRWKRDRLSDITIHALEESGRHDEIVPLCEQEAKLTKSYERLVRRLLAAGRSDDAERHIARGVAATYSDLPGIASSLLKLRAQIYSDRKDWAGVLAHHVCEFVESPSTADYEEVKRAATKMKRWPAVRASLLEYLRSGTSPWRQTGWDWPAPDEVELIRSGRWKKTFPKVEALIEIAILEKEPTEIAKWHDQLQKSGRYGTDWLELKVAEAVKKQDPDRALAIWKKLAEAEIALTKPAAYQAAGGYLKKAGQLMADLKREPEWHDYLVRLRAANARKKRFIEVLDAL